MRYYFLHRYKREKQAFFINKEYESYLVDLNYQNVTGIVRITSIIGYSFYFYYNGLCVCKLKSNSIKEYKTELKNTYFKIKMNIIRYKYATLFDLHHSTLENNCCIYYNGLMVNNMLEPITGIVINKDYTYHAYMNGRFIKSINGSDEEFINLIKEKVFA